MSRTLGLSRGDVLAGGRALSFLRGQGTPDLLWDSRATGPAAERNGASLWPGGPGAMQGGEGQGQVQGSYLCRGDWAEPSRDLARGSSGEREEVSWWPRRPGQGWEGEGVVTQPPEVMEDTGEAGGIDALRALTWAGTHWG